MILSGRFKHTIPSRVFSLETACDSRSGICLEGNKAGQADDIPGTAISSWAQGPQSDFPVKSNSMVSFCLIKFQLDFCYLQPKED